MSYIGTDVICLCFSVAYRASFDALVHVFVPEILQWCEWTGEKPPAMVLFGLRADIRTDKSARLEVEGRFGLGSPATFVSEAEARDFAHMHNMEYFELSARRDPEGLESAFARAVQIGYDSKDEGVMTRPRKSGCGCFSILFKRTFGKH